jgi:hypothetical protein
MRPPLNCCSARSSLHQDKTVFVTVLRDGFKYDCKHYESSRYHRNPYRELSDKLVLNARDHWDFDVGELLKRRHFGQTRRAEPGIPARSRFESMTQETMRSKIPFGLIQQIGLRARICSHRNIAQGKALRQKPWQRGGFL